MVEIPAAAAAPHLESQEEYSDHAVLHPKPRLREKALVKSQRPTPTDDADMIARAERAVDALAPSFGKWMAQSAATLLESVEGFGEAGPQSPEEVEALHLLAQDVRGQAKQFGYAVAAQMATGLCDHLAHGEVDVPMVVVRRYAEAIASVVRAEVKDAPNDIARELVRQLGVLSAEFRSRRAAEKAQAAAAEAAKDNPGETE